MSWTLFLQIIILILLTGIMVRFVVEGVYESGDRK